MTAPTEDPPRSSPLDATASLSANRLLRTALIGAVCWLAAYALVNYFSPNTPHFTQRLLDVFSMLPLVASTYFVARAAVVWGRRRSVDKAWTFFAISSGLSLVGAVIWTSGDTTASGAGVFGAVATTINCLASAAAIPAFFLSIRRRKHSGSAPSRFGFAVDFSLVGIGVGALGWYGLLAPALGDEVTVSRLLGLARPLSGILVVIVLLCLGLIDHRRIPTSVRLMACAYLATGVTDCCVLANGFQANPHHEGSWLNVGYQIAALLMLCGGLLASRRRPVRFARPARDRDLGAAPLLVAGVAVGLVAARGYLRSGGSLVPLLLVTVVLVGLVARQQLMLRDRARLSRRLSEALREQQELAVTDPLTGLRNRRFFEEALTTEVVRARRHGRPLSLVMLDIDYFKRINDVRGHAAGDEALVQFADLLRTLTRGGDVVARYGGEEFVWLLPDTDQDGASIMAERMRRALAALPIQLPDGELLRITASLGVSTGVGQVDPLDMISQADQALYRAKAAGRNRVCLAEPVPAPVAVPS